jgi:hypothetical protein
MYVCCIIGFRSCTARPFCVTLNHCSSVGHINTPTEWGIPFLHSDPASRDDSLSSVCSSSCWQGRGTTTGSRKLPGIAVAMCVVFSSVPPHKLGIDRFLPDPLQLISEITKRKVMVGAEEGRDTGTLDNRSTAGEISNEASEVVLRHSATAF